MAMINKSEDARRLAGLELNALRYAQLLPAETFEGAEIMRAVTPVYDVNGEVLFYRAPITRDRAIAAYADIAATDAFGAPLLAVSSGLIWDEESLVEQATVAARKMKGKLAYDTRRFVAFSYPKVAVQFLSKGEEVLMLELGTWIPVPPQKQTKRKPLHPSNFERWSLIDEIPAKVRAANARKLRARMALWKKLPEIDWHRISRESLALDRIKLRISESRELHYSTRDATHCPCYELRGQETNVWCVAASAQMVLEFYRYEYTQTRIAHELGLGTPSNPNGLPYSRDGDVVTCLETMTSNALDATMLTSPAFSVYENEIRANRPLVSFIPGHSRTVAGFIRYLIYMIGQMPFRGLLVYDPWPPNAGVITRWENFDAQTYRRAFTAHVRLI